MKFCIEVLDNAKLLFPKIYRIDQGMFVLSMKRYIIQTPVNMISTMLIFLKYIISFYISLILSCIPFNILKFP